MPEPSLKELLAASSLAFAGTVRAVGESAVEGVEPDDRTAVVEVDAPLQGPPAIDLSPGSSVTVQMSPDLPPLGAGDRATFFADPLVYGETLAVAEVGRTGAEAPPAAGARASAETPMSALEEAREELGREALLEHARTADAVVRGHVTGLEAVATDRLPHEHDPQWWIATLLVDVVERGTIPGVGEEGGEVRVLYANSLDRRWRSWPKPKAGQGGMWILHRPADARAGMADFEICHPEDLQPSLELDLLREGGPS